MCVKLQSYSMHFDLGLYEYVYLTNLQAVSVTALHANYHRVL